MVRVASVYVTHADYEKMLDQTLSASTTPTDTLVDNICEQIEGLAAAYLVGEGYTLAQANANSAAGLKAVLLEGVRWRVDQWYRWTQAGGAQSATDQNGTLTFEAAFDLPKYLKTALKGLVAPRPTVSYVDLI